MTKLLTTLAFAVALSAHAATSVPVALAADACPNAALRTGSSAALPDCRAYELVSTDSNHASLGNSEGRTAADGKTMVYRTYDAPDHAISATERNLVRATRDATHGWSGVSLAPPLPAPVSSYLATFSAGLAADLASTFVLTDQPLSGVTLPPGQHAFVGRPDGTYRLATLVGVPFDPLFATYPAIGLAGGTPDYSHVYFTAKSRQRPTDPAVAGNAYVWSEQRGTRLVGILPDGTPAPSGAGLAGFGLPAFSPDGKHVAFMADDRLYVRVDDAQTFEAGASQRTTPTAPDPPTYSAVGVTNNGKVFFTSTSELTDDANTGRTGGVATNAGRDLYSYDITSGTLTDLTADHNSADAATGANVRLNSINQPLVGATSDGSYIYFIATGALADGATSGRPSLFVWHDGRVDFVAPADNVLADDARLPFNFTPDGKHVVFASTDRLTGYDNTDPGTGQPHIQIFKATLGEGIECVSCRPDGSQPTDDSLIPVATLGSIRVISDDGRRVFFHSRDAIVPQASTGQQVIFEHADGKVAAISPVDGSSAPDRDLAIFLDASASGDDVFFTTYGTLVPNPNGGDQAVYDAKVGGGFPATSKPCSGTACQSPPTPAPARPPASGVAAFLDNNAEDLSAMAGRAKVVVSKVRTITGTTAILKVKVSGPGRVSVSGSGLRSVRVNPSKVQTVTVRVALTSKAAGTLRKRGSLKVKAIVRFVATKGGTSQATVALAFKSRSASKGR